MTENGNNTHKHKVLVTGAAGFIGSALTRRLLEQGYEVVGMDNINSYYDTRLKYARLALGGIAQEDIKDNRMTASTSNPGYRFIKLDLADRIGMEALFRTERFDYVVNLAGQAGVRYSIENPYAYVESNVLGFLNVLENCRHYPVKHLVYASSSSIYGMNQQVPYRESDKTETPVSLYAATKKSDELMAHAYSKLYGIPSTGLRFFTVYGPWGRPDMAPFLFLKAILHNEPIKVFNHGDMSRDFTYIDDILSGIMQVLPSVPTQAVPYAIYNIGHSSPVQLMDFISTIEKVSGRKAIKQMMDMQPGDVHCTYADTTRMEQDFGYHPQTDIEEGIQHFYDWYCRFYRIEQ